MGACMAKAYNLGIISGILCYTIEDVCDLYNKKKLHSQTVRKWFKQGLKRIDVKNPPLVFGNDLKEFLGNLNNRRKIELDFEEFYCLSCKESHKPYKNEVYIEQNQQFIRAKAVCPRTKNAMVKSYKLSDYQVLKSKFNLVDLLRLSDSLNSTLKTHKLSMAEKGLNESVKQEVFNYDK